MSMSIVATGPFSQRPLANELASSSLDDGLASSLGLWLTAYTVIEADATLPVSLSAGPDAPVDSTLA